MPPETIALLLSALGLGAAIAAGVKAWGDRKKVGADATSVLTAAARELVEPLRAELATERAERAAEHQQHVQELKDERASAVTLRRELDAAIGEARDLRQLLEAAQDEIADLREKVRTTLDES